MERAKKAKRAKRLELQISHFSDKDCSSEQKGEVSWDIEALGSQLYCRSSHSDAHNPCEGQRYWCQRRIIRFLVVVGS